MTFQYYTSYLAFDQVASIDPDFTFISAFIIQDIRDTAQKAPVSLFNNKIDHIRENVVTAMEHRIAAARR